MKKELYIIGAGSVGGHLALNIQDYTDEYDIMGFLDDDPEKIGSQQFGYNVVGSVKDALKLESVAIAIGIAFPKIKQRILDSLSKNRSLLYPSFIHNKAWISQNVTVGNGCIIYPGTTINFGSEISDFVVINVNCSLGHHTSIGTYSSLAPGVNTGGHTKIEEGVDMGIGASTLQNIHIGTESTVGGQSMVIENVEPKSIIAGVPAKIINSTK